MVCLNGALAVMLQPNVRQVWASSLNLATKPRNSLAQMLTVTLINKCMNVNLITMCEVLPILTA